MGQKFSEKLQKPMEKDKKIPHPQAKVQESLVPPAGIEPARYRYRGILSGKHRKSATIQTVEYRYIFRI